LNTGKPETVLRGNGVSRGVAIGNALKLDSRYRFILKTRLADDNLDAEVARFRKSIQISREQLISLRQRLEEKVGKEHSLILDAHLLMLEDPSMLAAIESIIKKSHANAEWAVQEAAERIHLAYEALEDGYFRERGRDIEYVVERILFNLSGHKPFSWDALPEDVIIMAHDLSPSVFAQMDIQKVRGVALESGGRTSHTAILARSLRLPTIMEIGGLLPFVKTGDPVILNADEGELVVWPTATRLQGARQLISGIARMSEIPQICEAMASATQDGIPISLRANTELPHEAAIAKRCGAEGIGLFRSEFIFFTHPQGPPGMEDQRRIYEMLAREMAPLPVAVRTLDTGIDRLVSSGDAAVELNPSMGVRGIRLSLAARDLFCAQVEAITRASFQGNLEIVIPMVSTVEEIREAKRIIEGVRVRIADELPDPERHIPLGVMIEVPAAVLTLDSIAREVDFLCVGTNDLVQYLLAVDRNNPQVAHLFQPLHPSVLQCLNRIAVVSLQHGKPARICGEVSTNPFFAFLLLGMGFRQLSMNPFAIPSIREAVSRMNMKTAEELAATALSMTTAQEISDFLIESVPRMLGMDLGSYVAEIKRGPLAGATGASS
jgi:phosphotransferase system enzyme I (PtsI)